MRYVIALIALIAGLAAGPALAERRLAFSVGIDVYDNLPAHEQLKKAVNDARAIGAALGDLGFLAVVEENVTKFAFTRAWQRFLERLEPGDTAAVFFAGHGVVIDGVNYLLPRDVPKVGPREDKVLAEWSIRFNDLMVELKRKGARVALFIVDACRDNPFRDDRARFIGVGGARGLTVVEPPKGCFILYSAGYGERALDRLSAADTEPNSPYTRALLPILKTPGLSMQQIATRVRAEVAGADEEGAAAARADARLLRPVARRVRAQGGRRRAAQVGHGFAGGDAERSRPHVGRRRGHRQHRRFGSLSPAIRQGQPRLRPVGRGADRRAEANGAGGEEGLRGRPQARPFAAAEGRGASGRGDARGRTGAGPGVPRLLGCLPEMVVLPAGAFMMGSPPGEPGRRASEGPERRVTIARPFAVGKFEVTFAESGGVRGGRRLHEHQPE